MNPTPKHGTPAGEATIFLRRLARQTGKDVQELMVLYALEGLLARISVSEYRSDFVLKGGVLLAAFAARRPTRDIDLQATHLTDDPDEVAGRARAIAVIDLSDGLMFDPASIVAVKIRDEDEYAGVRVKLTAALGTAKLRIGMDVNFGDPIWPPPQPIELPRIMDLGLPPVMLLGYPLTMVLAEKIITAIDRGPANTRWRDFADIYTLTRSHPVNAQQLRKSIEVVARYRNVAPEALLPRLEAMTPRSQQKYNAWRIRSHRETELPLALADLLSTVANFTDPVLSTTTTGDWNPHLRTWQ